MQKIYYDIQGLQDILQECKPGKTLLVCDNAFPQLSFNIYITNILDSCVMFQDFSPNPLYDDIVKGVELLNEQECDFIVAVGGGSAIDVAKCIKLYCKMDHNHSYLGQRYEENGIPLIAIPTTAGTGSESTHFAVIYANGEKQSVCHDAILPSHVILEHYALNSLPVYQKKCTMLDALCQAIESWWSVNSTNESKLISKQAVKLIYESMTGYLNNTDLGNDSMLRAANLAGQAINITQTTAAHAMSYKLTSLYSIPHGHAAALCLPAVWRYMLENMDKCTELRGAQYLLGVFLEIAGALGCDTTERAIEWFETLLCDLKIAPPDKVSVGDTLALAASVNATRLKNNPISIDYAASVSLYDGILAKVRL